MTRWARDAALLRRKVNKRSAKDLTLQELCFRDKVCPICFQGLTSDGECPDRRAKGHRTTLRLVTDA